MTTSRRSLITGAAALIAYGHLRSPAFASRLNTRDFRRPWQPGDLNSSGNQAVAAWWRARDKALMIDDGSGLISSWADRCTGLAITATTTARATWGATSFNSSYPGMTFDGSANCYVTTALTSLPTGSSPGEIWVVSLGTNQGLGVAAYALNYGGTSAGTGRIVGKTNAGNARVSDGSTTNSSNTVQTTPGHIWSGNWSGTVQNGFLDGTAFGTNPATISSLNTGTTRARVGASNSTSASLFYQGVISDIMVLLGVLSTADRQRMEGFFAWNRGLVSVLPASHPYVGAPP